MTLTKRTQKQEALVLRACSLLDKKYEENRKGDRRAGRGLGHPQQPSCRTIPSSFPAARRTPYGAGGRRVSIIAQVHGIFLLCRENFAEGNIWFSQTQEITAYFS